MPKLRELMRKRWFGNAVAGCLTVIVYLVLSHLAVVKGAIGTFFGYFAPVIGGCVIAFLMNPLAKMYECRVFRFVKKPGTRWLLCVVLTIITVILFLALILLMLVPQLVDSITTFVGNLHGYASTVQAWLEKLGVNAESASIDIQSVIDSSENILQSVVTFISDNSKRIISVSTTAGKGVFNWVIAFILSVYLLSAKNGLTTGTKRLMSALLRPDHCEAVIRFFRRCEAILNRYVVYNLLDSLIVGVANMLFMTVMRMQYGGLVSVVAAVTNLVPTFGPFIGAIIGGFILVMVRPLHALIFLGFTLILQLLDGYVIKPRLFGNSLGVSGLWILIAVIVGGRIIGVIGILLAIPFVAILDQLYKENLLPVLERRRARLDHNAAAAAGPPEPQKKE